MPLQTILDENTLALVRQYKAALAGGEKLGSSAQQTLDILRKDMGQEDKEKLSDAAFIAGLSDALFVQLIIGSKYGAQAAEGSDEYRERYNEHEREILHKICMSSDVSIFADGKAYGYHHEKETVYTSPMLAHYSFVCGPLLARPDSPDYTRVVFTKQDGKKEINPDQYDQLIEEKILLLLQDVNETGKAHDKQMLLRIPALGCGRFAGTFTGKGIHEHFYRACVKALNKHLQDFKRIGAVDIALADKADQDEVAHFDAVTKNTIGQDATVRHLGDKGDCEFVLQGKAIRVRRDHEVAQFSHPDDIERQGMMLAVCVATDPIGSPGGDAYRNKPDTQEGITGTRSDICERVTGDKGEFDEKDHMFIPKDKRLWEEHAPLGKVLAKAHPTIKVLRSGPPKAMETLELKPEEKKILAIAKVNDVIAQLEGTKTTCAAAYVMMPALAKLVKAVVFEINIKKESDLSGIRGEVNALAQQLGIAEVDLQVPDSRGAILDKIAEINQTLSILGFLNSDADTWKADTVILNPGFWERLFNKRDKIYTESIKCRDGKKRSIDQGVEAIQAAFGKGPPALQIALENLMAMINVQLKKPPTAGQIKALEGLLGICDAAMKTIQVILTPAATTPKPVEPKAVGRFTAETDDLPPDLGKISPDILKNRANHVLLQAVSFNGNLDALRRAISDVEDVNVVDGAGNTPLHMAVFTDKLDFVRELIKAGADMEIKNQDGKTALDIAKSLHKDDITAILLLPSTSAPPVSPSPKPIAPPPPGRDAPPPPVVEKGPTGVTAPGRPVLESPKRVAPTPPAAKPTVPVVPQKTAAPNKSENAFVKGLAESKFGQLVQKTKVGKVVTGLAILGGVLVAPSMPATIALVSAGAMLLTKGKNTGAIQAQLGAQPGAPAKVEPLPGEEKTSQPKEKQGESCELIGKHRPPQAGTRAEPKETTGGPSTSAAAKT